jgi:hypothetical protein
MRREILRPLNGPLDDGGTRRAVAGVSRYEGEGTQANSSLCHSGAEGVVRAQFVEGWITLRSSAGRDYPRRGAALSRW